jgi:uncharacterized membrane protein YkvA (DUF1232 family)
MRRLVNRALVPAGARLTNRSTVAPSGWSGSALMGGMLSHEYRPEGARKMTEWWHVLLGIVGGLLLLWFILVVILWRGQRPLEAAKLGDLLRLVPDVARLLRRLAADHTLYVGVRVWLIVILVYLLSPIDLIPDFIPVLGYADDAVVIVLAIRFAMRWAGRAAIERHWPGTEQGLEAVLRLAGA